LSGLNKETKLLVFSFIAVLLVVFLYTRPKTVVKDADQTTQKTKKEEASPSKESLHELSPALKSKLAAIRSSKESQTKILNDLGLAFAAESVFDSAGFYFAKLAKLNPSLVNILKTADTYNQAYSLAIDPANAEQLAEQTRSFYSKALTLDPENLYAKTNLASTYVKSETPMKAITMLREVVETNPNYIPAILSLGGLSMQSNQYDKAILRFKKVLTIDPKNVNAKLGLAYSFIETNKKLDAKIILQELLKADINQVMKDEINKTLNTLK
jgi:outer membrane protein